VELTQGVVIQVRTEGGESVAKLQNDIIGLTGQTRETAKAAQEAARGVDQFAQSVGRTSAAVSGSTTMREIAKSTDAIGVGAQRAQKAIDQFWARLDQGGAVSAGAWRAVATQTKLYEMELERAFGTIDKATPEARAELARLKGETALVTDATRTLTNAVRDQSGELKEAGVAWRGIGESIQQAAGKYGMMIAKAGVALFALRESYDLFKKIGDTTGVDYSATEALTKDAKKKVGAPFHERMGAIELMLMNFGTGRWDRMMQDYALNNTNLLSPIGSQAGYLQSIQGPAAPSFAQLLQGQALTTLREQAEAVERQEKAAAALKQQWVEINRVLASQVKDLRAKDPWTLIDPRWYTLTNQEIGGAYASASRGIENGLWDQASQLGTTVGMAKLDPAQLTKASRSIAEENQKLLDRWSQSTRAFGDVLYGFTTTGAHNFGEIASSYLGNIAADTLSRGIESFLTPQQNEEGKWTVAGRTYDDETKANTAARMWRGAIDVGMSGMAGYGAGFSGAPGSRTASLAATTLAAAATGNPYVAAAMIIANVVGSALGAQQRQEQYKYGVPNFVNGQASLAMTKNIQTAERNQMVSALQETFTSNWNTFAKILLTLPGAQMPGIPRTFGSAFQPEASANYMKHFDEYLKDTLPREIAGLFKSGMQNAFISSGMTQKAFESFWNEASKMDAASRGQFWSDLAEGVAALARAQQNLQQLGGMSTYVDMLQGSVSTGRYQFNNGRLMDLGESTFTADIRAAGEGLFKIGREMVNLTGPDRIAAFKALGQGVEAVTKSLQEYIQQIGETIANLRNTFADERLNMAVNRAGTNKEKSDLLWGSYNYNLSLIQNSKDPAEIDRLTRRNIELLNQIYNLDPTAEMYAWWQRQLTDLETVSRTALERIASDATTQVTNLVKSLKPFTDWVLGQPVELAPAFAALDTQIRGASDALRDLEAAIRSATGGGNSGGQQSGGSGGNRPPIDTNSVTIQVTVAGDVYGVADLDSRVVGAVRRAVAANPNVFDGAF
jgi:hypothetical protein